MTTLDEAQAEFKAEATQSAIQRISDILRHPDDLTNKLPLVRKKIAAERAAIEAQLKTAIELQLDNSSKGLDLLHYSKNETLTMKDTLTTMDKVCSEAQNMIKNYNHIKKISKTHQNFIQTKNMAEQFKQLNQQVKRTSKLLEDDCRNVIGPQDNILLVHYHLQLLEKFRNNTMVQARGASVELLSLLSNLFKKVDVLEARFDTHIWDLAYKLMDLLKTGHKSTIVRLAKIIEMEESFDETSVTLDNEDLDSEAKSIELEFTRGRKVKAYRVKFFDIVRNSIVKRIERIAAENIEDVSDLLKEADTVIDDLIIVKEELSQLVPPSYNIYRYYCMECHRTLYDMFETTITEGAIGPGSILLLLKWVRDYYVAVDSRLCIPQEILEPRLLEGREEELVNGYISLVRSKLSEWLKNILNRETVIFLSRSSPPEVDGDGQYLTAGSQIDVAITSSLGQLLYDVVLVCVDVITEYQNAWMKILDQEFQKFVEKSKDLSDGLPEYVMGLSNDCLRSTEFTENLKERIVTLADEPFKEIIGAKLKELLNGFMTVSKKAYQVLIDIMLIDIKPAVAILNVAPQWYDQDIMRFIIGTFEDYCHDLQAHLNEYIFKKLMTELTDKFVIIYIECFKGKNVKFNMPQAGVKLKEDLSQVIEFFAKSKSSKKVEAIFDPIQKLIGLIDSNARLIYIDFFSLYKPYPDVPIEFVEKVLGKRSDLDRSQISEIISGINEKLEEEKQEGKNSDRQTGISNRQIHKKTIVYNQQSPDTPIAIAVPETYPNIENKPIIPGPAANLPVLSPSEKQRLFKSKGSTIVSRLNIPADITSNDKISIIKPFDDDFNSVQWTNMESSMVNKDSITVSEIFANPCKSKISKLVVMIIHLTSSFTDSGGMFKDKTGEIHGTIHKNVLDSKIGQFINAGSVIVLNDFSIFKPSKTSRYLNITLSNVESVFTVDGNRYFNEHIINDLDKVDLKIIHSDSNIIQDTPMHAKEKPSQMEDYSDLLADIDAYAEYL